MVLVNEGSGAALGRRRFLRLAGVALASAAVGLLPGCASSPQPSEAAPSGEAPAQPVVETAFAFDTVITLTAYCDEAVMAQLLERCRYFEERFSRTLEGSDVWNINHAGGAAVEVAAETAEVIRRGLEFGEASGGLFDITIGAVSSLWDFKEGVRPADEELREAVTHVDYRCVQLEANTVTLSDPRAMIDLGGIAKGYIADDLGRMLREAGCGSAIINLGGNVAVVGGKPDGSPWRVGVQDPNAPTGSAVVAAIDCEDASVVTSGLYERTFTQDGVRYHHILDPRTGYPAETDLASSSIVCDSSLEGDACATWMFLLGHDGALEYLESADGLEGMVVNQAGDVTATSGASFMSV